VSENFGVVVVADFEFEISGGDYNLRSGDIPMPLCLVAHVLDEDLRHVRTIRLWRDELLAAKCPPFDVGPDVLFVAYSAQAELMCFKALDWRFPVHVFDLHTAFLARSNVLLPYNPDEKRNKPRKRLSDACRAYGIEGWENIDKETIAKDIGEGHWCKYGRERILDYCEEDVRMSVRLLRAQLRGLPGLPPADIERVLFWSSYGANCVALIQARGMPIDMPMWNLVQENKGAVIGELLRWFDPSYGSDAPIYTPEGEWSYERFEQYLVRTGVAAWPRLDSGRLNVDSDAFRLMYHVPGIEGLHALRDSLSFIVKHPAMRNRMKVLQLAISYGMGVPSLARGLDRHALIASEIIERHKRSYPRFWQWRADMVQSAMLARRMESVFGWPLHITTSPNQRTLYNFPMQSGGAEMLRLATMRLCEAGIVPVMLVHDGILFEEAEHERIEQAKEIMRSAGRDICNGLTIDVEVDQMLKNGARYHDKRPVAQQMWATVMRALEAVGAMPKRKAS